MDDNETIEDSLLQLITCAVCQDEVEQLKVLPCQHTICLTCVKLLPVLSNRFKCPLCVKEQLVPNGGYEQLPNSLMCQQIADLVNRKRAKAADKQTDVFCAEVKHIDGETEAADNRQPDKAVVEHCDDSTSVAEEKKPEHSSEEDGREGHREAKAPSINLSQLSRDLERALKSGTECHTKAEKMISDLKTARDKIPEDSETTKDAIAEYQKSIDLKCKQKLLELEKIQQQQTTEVDSALTNFQPNADQIQAAVDAAPDLLSKLSNENCSPEDVSAAQQLLQHLTDLERTIDIASFKHQQHNSEEVTPGDSVCLKHSKDSSVAELINGKVSMASVGIFIGYHAEMIPKQQQLGVDTILKPLVIFPEKHNWKGASVQCLKKSHTKAKLPGLGDRVRVKASVKTPHFSWKGVTAKESRGFLKALEFGADAPEDDLVVNIDFSEERGWKGLYSEIEFVPGCGFEVGEEVMVKSSIPEPSRGWGGITRSSVGKITKIEGAKGKEEITVDFPECKDWVGFSKELEVPRKLMKGDLVQVRLNVKTPHLGWNGISHTDVGQLQKIVKSNESGDTAQVKFPQKNTLWSCKLNELEQARYPAANIAPAVDFGANFPFNLNLDGNAFAQAAESFQRMMMPGLPQQRDSV